MKNCFASRLIAALVLSACMGLAQAGTQALGVEIGETTPTHLKQSLAKQVKMESRGANKYSGGEMYHVDGDAYDVEGLKGVLYIFDERQRLAGILMEMNKGRFDAVYHYLTNKYKVVSQQRPFVGDHYALFKPSDAFIELDAPHLSFDMTVRYVRNDLMQQFKAKSQGEAAAKKRSEASKF